MLPFSFQPKGGLSIYQQVIYAVKKALMVGSLRPGDRFPSVRKLSQELKINPNTAHKVVAALVDEGLLEVRPGIGTIVLEPPADRLQERNKLLGDALERIAVEAHQLQIELPELLEALSRHWQRLEGK